MFRLLYGSSFELIRSFSRGGLIKNKKQNKIIQKKKTFAIRRQNTQKQVRILHIVYTINANHKIYIFGGNVICDAI